MATATSAVALVVQLLMLMPMAATTTTAPFLREATLYCQRGLMVTSTTAAEVLAPVPESMIQRQESPLLESEQVLASEQGLSIRQPKLCLQRTSRHLAEQMVGKLVSQARAEAVELAAETKQ